jgi:hypothetical protein
MSQSPFIIQPLKKPNIFHKALRTVPKRNALIELCNELANDSIQDVKLANVETICNKYSVTIQKKYKKDLVGLYKDYLVYCLSDQHLTSQELEDLAHLKVLFAISDTEANALHEELTRNLYKKTLVDSISDGRLSDKEREFLANLKSKIGLSAEIADNIFTKTAQERVQQYINEAIEDRRLSPQEDLELQKICESLGAEINLDSESKATLEKFRLFWQIENGDVPTIEPDINLHRNELCYFKTDVGWWEYRKQTKRIRYGGLTARVPIAKGLYIRAGDLGIKPVSEDVFVQLDSGLIYLTNKRVIFRGTKKNKTIRIPKILTITPYKNGVDIEKDTGKSPFLDFSKNIDLFCIILNRAMLDY